MQSKSEGEKDSRMERIMISTATWAIVVQSSQPASHGNSGSFMKERMNLIRLNININTLPCVLIAAERVEEVEKPLSVKLV